RGDTEVRLAPIVYPDRVPLIFLEPHVVRGDLTVNPHIVTLGLGQGQQFTAVLNGFEGRPEVPAQWAASAGTINQNGFFTYPSHPVGDILITATTVADSSVSATAAVIQGIIAISPASASPPPGGTQQFTA